jgi:hypothetical protein
MFPRFCEVAPQSRFRSSDADFETLAGLAVDAVDAPVHAFPVSVREKIGSGLRDTLAQQFFDSSRVAHRLKPALNQATFNLSFELLDLPKHEAEWRLQNAEQAIRLSYL